MGAAVGSMDGTFDRMNGAVEGIADMAPAMPADGEMAPVMPSDDAVDSTGDGLALPPI